MKLYLGVFLTAAPLFGAYTYYYSDSLTSINATNWTQNGSVSGSASGLTATTTNGGSLISKVAVAANYEVKATVTLAASGGSYVTYIRATSNAQSGPALAGTAYAVELQNPTISSGICTGATLTAYQIVSGHSTTLSSSAVPCHSGMVLRTVLIAAGALITYIDNLQYLDVGVSAITAAGS